MTVGVGIFGVLASFLANLFLPKSSEDQDDEVPASTADLASIQAQLEAMNTRLDALQSMLSDGDLPPTADVGREPSGLGVPGQSPVEQLWQRGTKFPSDAPDSQDTPDSQGAVS
jgi:hypothetical protein